MLPYNPESGGNSPFEKSPSIPLFQRGEVEPRHTHLRIVQVKILNEFWLKVEKTLSHHVHRVERGVRGALWDMSPRPARPARRP